MIVDDKAVHHELRHMADLQRLRRRRLRKSAGSKENEKQIRQDGCEFHDSAFFEDFLIAIRICFATSLANCLEPSGVKWTLTGR